MNKINFVLSEFKPRVLSLAQSDSSTNASGMISVIVERNFPDTKITTADDVVILVQFSTNNFLTPRLKLHKNYPLLQ